MAGVFKELGDRSRRREGDARADEVGEAASQEVGEEEHMNAGGTWYLFVSHSFLPDDTSPAR